MFSGGFGPSSPDDNLGVSTGSQNRQVMDASHANLAVILNTTLIELDAVSNLSWVDSMEQDQPW